MGYDVEFIQIKAPAATSFPVEAAQADKLVSRAAPFRDPEAVQAALLAIKGTRPGPDKSIDFVGRGLNCARLSVHGKAIHVENNCSAGELLTIYGTLVPKYPDLLILDLQSKQLHNAASFREWWSRPL